MRFEILLMTEQGVYTEHTLDLPVSAEIAWDDFVNLRAVKDLLLANPHAGIIDITPEDLYEDSITTELDLHDDVDSLLNNI